MEDRKVKEVEFHDLIRSPEMLADPARREYYTSNKKWYTVARESDGDFKDWIRQRCSGKRLLDFGTGDGEYAMFAASCGAEATGIDISPVSVDNATREAARRGLGSRATFVVQDGEQLNLPDASFDLICESGVLHHVDLDTVFAEMARVLTPDGEAICLEALVHNPIIHWYRQRTPHLRTEYEVAHILSVDEIQGAKKYFGRMTIRYYHLAVLLAVPFRRTRLFGPLLSVLETVDAVLLRIPGLQRLAWIAIFTLGAPRHAVRA